MFKVKTITLLLVLLSVLSFVYAEEDEELMSQEEEYQRHKFFDQ